MLMQCPGYQHPRKTESISDYEAPVLDVDQVETAEEVGTKQTPSAEHPEISSASCQAAGAVLANWLEGRTRTELRECQRRDPVLGKIIQWRETRNALPTWEYQSKG